MEKIQDSKKEALSFFWIAYFVYSFCVLLNVYDKHRLLELVSVFGMMASAISLMVITRIIIRMENAKINYVFIAIPAIVSIVSSVIALYLK